MARLHQQLQRMSRHDPALQEFLSSIWSICSRDRKALVKILRGRVFPESNTLVYKRNKTTLRTDLTYTHQGIERSCKIIDILRSIRPYITSPILSGFLLSSIISAPLLDHDAELLVKESLMKEIKASVEWRKATPLNWDSVLSTSRSIREGSILAPFMMTSPDISFHLFRSLSSSKHLLTRRTIYPRYSRKTIGTRSRELLHDVWGLHDIEYDPSTLGLERLYHRTGVEIEGPTEMRMAFKYNDLRPRCYFAQGPSQYYSSRYVQPIFNIILDCVDPVGRFSRFNTSGVRAEPDEDIFIYDYASFTSRLVELPAFIAELAEFYRDINVTLFDTYQGRISVNLGDLLDQYNKSCNFLQPFVLAQNIDKAAFEENVVLYHQSGMLGVPGNISSCTLLHGMYLVMLCMDLMARCVGDDAIGKLPLIDRGMLHRHLEGIGDIAVEKMEIWRHIPLEVHDPETTTLTYTKRPITRIGDRVLVDLDSIVFPSLCIVDTGLGDSFHTIQKRDVDPLATARILITFARQFHRFTDLLEIERTLVNNWISTVCELGGLRYQNQKGILKYKEGLIYPRNLEECDLRKLLERYEVSGEVVRIPDLHCVMEEPKMCEEFSHRSSAMLRIIEDMGYLTKEMNVREELARDAIDDIRRLFLVRDVSPTYRYYISDRCPSYMFDELCGTPVVEDVYDFLGGNEEVDYDEI